MSVEDIKNQFLIQDEDRKAGGSDYRPYYPAVTTYENSTVTPLVDGDNYFADLECTINDLEGDPSEQGIFIAGWLFSDIGHFTLPVSGKTVMSLLAEKAAAGADVRVLIWINRTLARPAVETVITTTETLAQSYVEGVEGTPIASTAKFAAQLQTWADDMQEINIEAFHALRTESAYADLTDRVIANTLGKNMGAVHMKFAVVFDATKAAFYTGGMDMDSERKSDSTHLTFADLDGNGYEDDSWHDVQVKVEGDAVQAAYDYYRQIWNELITERDDSPERVVRLRYLDQELSGTPVAATNIDARTLPVSFPGWPTTSATSSELSPSAGSYFEDYSPWAGIHAVQSLRTVPKKQGKGRISFSEDGIYEIQLALEKAIGNAEKYVYIEDQAVWSRTILGYLRDAMLAKPDLRVVILTGAVDPTATSPSKVHATVHQYLLSGLSEGEEQQVKSQMVVAAHFRTVHSKLFIIDDKFALIGSAGMFDRVLHIEMEHSISFIDNSEDRNTVRDLRVRLWSEHFKLSDDEKERIADIDTALNIWNPSWGTDAGVKLPHYAETYDELTDNLINGMPASLMQWHILQREDALFYAQTQATYFVAGDETYIEAADLPTPDTDNLQGFYICVVRGPNAGVIRRVSSHQGQRLSFDAMPHSNDDSTADALATTEIVLTKSYIDIDAWDNYDTAYPFVILGLKFIGE